MIPSLLQKLCAYGPVWPKCKATNARSTWSRETSRWQKRLWHKRAMSSNALAKSMAGANGANGTDQRGALAIEADQLISQVIEIANAKGSQGYLFSGTRVDAPAFDATGVFTGNDAQHLVQTGTGDPIAVNVSGAQAFTAAGGRDVIQDLRDLVAGLQANDVDAIRGTLDGLQASNEQINRERSHSGLILNRLELSENILSQADLDLSKRDADVVSADPAETFSRLSQLEGAINNSVTVGKRLLDIANIQRF